MKRIKPQLNAKKHIENYQQVFNSDKERVRGLWLRSDKYYAQLRATNGKPYRYVLDAKTIPQAVLSQQALKLKQQAGTLFPPGGAPDRNVGRNVGQSTKLRDLILKYQQDRDGLGKKSDGSGKREDSGLKFWTTLFGSRGAETIGAVELSAFAVWRKREFEVGGRAVDMDILALSHAYEFGRRHGYVRKDFPDFEWSKLAEPPTKDELLTPEQMDVLCNAALLDPDALELLDTRFRHLRVAQTVSGQSFHDYPKK